MANDDLSVGKSKATLGACYNTFLIYQSSGLFNPIVGLKSKSFKSRLKRSENRIFIFSTVLNLLTNFDKQPQW